MIFVVIFMYEKATFYSLYCPLIGLDDGARAGV
jgi:hypothetical protein